VVRPERSSTVDGVNRRILVKLRVSVSFLILIGSIAFCTAIAERPANAENPQPSAKVVELDTHGKDYLPLLSGPPESVTMRSGLVVLEPQKSVGKHTTGQNEEILIVLEGSGEMIFHDRNSLPVQANHAIYCPPQTEHDVRNTGTTILRYVYVVASAK
jgi:mannose-6-phosphate isomerase-like protein (cupin superfamily)